MRIQVSSNAATELSNLFRSNWRIRLTTCVCRPVFIASIFDLSPIKYSSSYGEYTANARIGSLLPVSLSVRSKESTKWSIRSPYDFLSEQFATVGAWRTENSTLELSDADRLFLTQLRLLCTTNWFTRLSPRNMSSETSIESFTSSPDIAVSLASIFLKCPDKLWIPSGASAK